MIISGVNLLLYKLRLSSVLIEDNVQEVCFYDILLFFLCLTTTKNSVPKKKFFFWKASYYNHPLLWDKGWFSPFDWDLSIWGPDGYGPIFFDFSLAVWKIFCNFAKNNYFIIILLQQHTKHYDGSHLYICILHHWWRTW